MFRTAAIAVACGDDDALSATAKEVSSCEKCEVPGVALTAERKSLAAGRRLRKWMTTKTIQKMSAGIEQPMMAAMFATGMARGTISLFLCLRCFAFSLNQIVREYTTQAILKLLQISKRMLAMIPQHIF